VAALELENMIEVAGLMAKAALQRTESRGSHYREDHPAPDQAQEHNIILDHEQPQGFFTARLGDL